MRRLAQVIASAQMRSMTSSAGMMMRRRRSAPRALAAYLSEAKTGTAVKLSTEAITRARAEQQAILKPLRD